jgi:Lon protease-like protein
MHGDLLPIFPLAVVLLPGNELPLHIFEERYKQMIAMVLERGGEFGVVLATQGGIAAAGCTATVEAVTRRYEDGRMDIVAVGRRRFNIRSLDEQEAYLRGEVDYFEDSIGEASSSLRRDAIAACDRVEESTAERQDTGDPQLSFRLAPRFSDLMFQQQLLTIRSEADRLRRIIDFVPTYSTRMREADRIRHLAGQNGHSAHRPGGVDE